MNAQMPIQLVNAEEQKLDRELPEKSGIPAKVLVYVIRLLKTVVVI